MDYHFIVFEYETVEELALVSVIEPPVTTGLFFCDTQK